MALQRAILFVKDLEGMTAFYRDGFGLRAKGQPAEGWVELSSRGASLGLHAIPPQLAASIVIASPPKPREDTPIKLVFAATPTLARARARLAKHGAVMHEPKPWGACDGLDPEGNVFQIVGQKRRAKR